MAMKGIFFNIFAAAALLLGTSLLTTACSGNDDDAISEVPEGTAEYVKVPYSVTVNSGSVTRATAEDKELYFSEGDMLHVEGWYLANDLDTKIYCYGNLTMTSGADSQSATFEGDLYVPVNSKLSDFKNVDYFLIGENDKVGDWYDQLWSDNRWDPYIASEMSEAVEKYSNIGYHTSEGFTDDEIQLAQRNAFMSFQLDLPFDKLIINEVTAITVTYTRAKLKIPVTVRTPDGFSASADPSKWLEFVVPLAVGPYFSNGERVTDIEVTLTTGNGNTLRVNVPCGNEGKALVGGRVYRVQMKVPAPANIVNPQVGEIVKFGNREGMVVELSGGQKVAVALYNEGGDSDDYLGTKTKYVPAFDNYQTDGWYIPKAVEFRDFANQNQSKIEFLVDANMNNIARYHIVNDGHYHRTLDIPFAIGNNDNEKEQFDDYWTQESAGDYTHVRTFGYQYETNGDVITIKPYFYQAIIAEHYRYVRLFHAIP